MNKQLTWEQEEMNLRAVIAGETEEDRIWRMIDNHRQLHDAVALEERIQRGRTS